MTAFGALRKGLGDVHAAELGFPLVDARIADAVLAAQVRDHDAGLVLLQDADDLFFGKTVTPHTLVLELARANFKLDWVAGVASTLISSEHVITPIHC